MKLVRCDFAQWKIVTEFSLLHPQVSVPSGCRWGLCSGQEPVTTCCVLCLVRKEMQRFQGKSAIFFYFMVG